MASDPKQIKKTNKILFIALKNIKCKTNIKPKLRKLFVTAITKINRNLTSTYKDKTDSRRKSYFDPSLTWKNFNLAEQANVIIVPRSDN